MAFNLASVSRETRTYPPRIVLLGTEKIGKSSFAAGAEKPIFIEVRGEQGIDSLPVARFPVCNSFSDVKACLYSLFSEPHDFSTVVIDSISTLEPLIWVEACRVNGNVDSIEKLGGGYGKGYLIAIDYWRQLTEALDDLRIQRGMVSILIGHVRVRSHTDPVDGVYDRWQADLNEKAASHLYRWSDVLLFANTKVAVRAEDAGFNKQAKRAVDISGGQRYLFTGKSPAFPSGGRGPYGHLPATLPLNWDNFMDAVSAVMEKKV